MRGSQYSHLRMLINTFLIRTRPRNSNSFDAARSSDRVTSDSQTRNLRTGRCHRPQYRFQNTIQDITRQLRVVSKRRTSQVPRKMDTLRCRAREVAVTASMETGTVRALSQAQRISPHILVPPRPQRSRVQVRALTMMNPSYRLLPAQQRCQVNFHMSSMAGHRCSQSRVSISLRLWTKRRPRKTSNTRNS